VRIKNSVATPRK